MSASTRQNIQPIHTQPQWKTELSQCITSTDDLLHRLQLDSAQLSVSQQAALTFPLRVSKSYIQRMQPGNANDPLLAQVLPTSAELASTQGYSRDPLKESDYNPVPGIVHKYRNRLLLIISPSCAINCRYCFRRHFPYQHNRQNKQQWQRALDYIGSAREINEVIYSGGDPLVANDHFLNWLTEQIAAIPHIKRLRIHTRLPVVIPSRINRQLLQWITKTHLTPIVVLHINHPNEINTDLAASIQLLVSSGITVFNQTVLLKHINDQAETLVKLSERLFDIGVMPYYLHLLDPVQGASHFDVATEQAVKIYARMQIDLPGFLLPKLVRETVGEQGKTLITGGSRDAPSSTPD